MKWLALLSSTALIGFVGCASDQNPTQPDSEQDAVSAATALATNVWTTRAPYNGIGRFGTSAGMAPNSTGQSIVYLFGGTDGVGGTGYAVQAYNVSTNTWTTKAARVGVFYSNGVGKIGSRLYFSGGSPEVQTPSTYTNQVLAYDYINDRMIQKAKLPIFSGEGVSGVIDGKLYVLPGACSGEGYPFPGYCAEERTRRFYRYNPATDAWTSRAPSPHYHRGGAAGVINGKLYVAAGLNNFTKVAHLDVYNPATDSWSTLAPVPAGGRAIGTVLGGRFYVITQTGTYAYNPATNTWKSRASPASGHDDVVKATLNGTARLVAVGGSDGTDIATPNATELYTP